MIKNAIKKLLDIDKLENQMHDMDQRVKTVELQTTTAIDQAASMLSRFGTYENRTSEELQLMKAQIADCLNRVDELDTHVQGQIGDLLDSVDAIDMRMEAEQQAKRARTLIKNMRKRLKNNQGRITKALARLQGA